MKSLKIGAGILSLAMLVVPLGVSADSHEEEAPAPLTDVWIMVPKQGMEVQFNEAAAAHMAYRTENEDSRDWQAYRSVIGKHTNVIQYRACCFNWADQDAYVAESNEKGFGDHWNENVHPYVDHYHHYIEETDWENSHWPESETDYKYYGVTSWQLKQGVGPGPSEARKKISQLAKEHGWGDVSNGWLWLSRNGGSPTLMIVSRFENYADMEPPETSFFEMMSEQVGEETMNELFTTFGSGSASSDYTVWAPVAEISAPSEDE